MRHRMAGRKLGRKTNHRIAMWRNMAEALITHGQITTTLPKAKSLKPFIERLITLAKQNDLHARRRAISMLGKNELLIKGEDDENIERNRYGEITYHGRLKAPRIVNHLFDEIGPRYADRTGGYTRIIKLARHRIGDGADLCVMQLVGDESGPQVSGQPSRRRTQADRRTAFAKSLRKGGGDDTGSDKAATGTGKEPQASADHDGGDVGETAEGARTPLAEEQTSSDAVNEGGESGNVTEAAEEGRGGAKA